MIRPRFIAKLLANICGYFWLPCPLCGEEFAGFEWCTEHDNSSIIKDYSTSTGVCHNCHQKAKEYNERIKQTQRWKDWKAEAMENYRRIGIIK